jgi:hypothetical protein
MALRPTEGLAPERYEGEAGQARRRVIASIDRSHRFFTERAPARVVLFPASYALDEAQFAALRQAAARVSDIDGFYLHSVERHAPRPEEPQDWWIAFDAYESYRPAVSSENLLHSASGRWALLALHDDAVVVGGTPAFTDTLLERWPAHAEDAEIYGARRQVEAYLAGLARIGRRATVMQWLPSLLTHVYGPAEAARLLSIYQRLPSA